MTLPRSRDLLVRLAQQALQAQQHGLHIVDGAPLLLQNVEADATGEVDIGVVDGRLEKHSRRDVGVVLRERERQLERQTGVRRALRTFDGASPLEEIGLVGEGRHAGRGRHHERHQLGLEAVRGMISCHVLRRKMDARWYATAWLHCRCWRAWRELRLC